MRVTTLYNKNEYIDTPSYIKKCGLDNTQEFLLPTSQYVESYQSYYNIDKAVTLIGEYIDKTIYILIDCDVDGYTSAAEMYLYLNQINNDVNVIPLLHEKKLHGLSDATILSTLQNSEAGLLIIPDASGSDDEYKLLCDIGYEILVIDHHNIQDSEYAAVVNNQLSHNVINKQGSGAIVVHQVLRALDDYFNVKYAYLYTDLATMGNIGDVMEMNNYYNRTYNHYGFKMIYNPFIRTLKDTLVKDELTPHNVSFKIVPKINAVIRSDDNELKKKVFSALIGEIDQEEVAKVAKECVKAHTKQSTLTIKVVHDITSLLNKDDKINIIQYSDMPSSYTGLIAGRISGDTRKPTILVKDNLIGSLRSPIPLRSILSTCPYVDWCQGHERSAGIKINDLDKFKEWCNNIDLDINTEYVVLQSYTPSKIPKYLFKEFYGYDYLWGKGIEEPVFYIHDLQINSDNIRTLGKNKTTVKFTYKGIEYIKFIMSHDDQMNILHIDESKELNVNLIGKFNLNVWNGKTTPQCIIEQIEVSIKQNDTKNIDDVF